jgi:hypothetical protein
MQSSAPNGAPQWPYSQILYLPEKLVRDKHSSLIHRSFCDKEKKFFDIDSRSPENERLILMREVVQQLPPPNYR